jgi:hypothetical protein
MACQINATDTSPILPAGPNNRSLRFQISPVPHFSLPGGDRCPYCEYFYDEIVIEAGDGIEDQVQTIVKEGMEEAFKLIIPEVPFVAEVRVAAAWG